MSRFRPRRYSSEPSDHSASFDIDDEGRLWLARATLHQLLRDTDEEGIPKAIAQSLVVKTVFSSMRDGRSVTGADLRPPPLQLPPLPETPPWSHTPEPNTVARLQPIARLFERQPRVRCKKQ